MNAPFVVYDRATGRVLRSGSCEPGYECDQVDGPDEDYLPVDITCDPNAVVVVGGMIVGKK